MNKNKIQWWIGGQPYPLTLPNLLAWWDSGATYMASDGSQWTDRSSNALNLTASGTAKPTYAAWGWTLDGVANKLSRSKITQIQNASSFTLFMVGTRSVMAQDDGTTNNWTELNAFSDNTTYNVVSNGSATYGSVAGSTSGFNIYILVYDGTQTGNSNRLKLYKNGVLQTLTFTGTIPAASENGASSAFKIGSRVGSFLAGITCSAGIVTRAINSTEINNLNTYLTNRHCFNCYFEGDSITIGYDGTSNITNNWVNLFCAAKGYRAINQAISGTPLESATTVIAGNLYDNRTTRVPTKTSFDKYFIISYGVNDCGYNTGNYTTTLFKTQYQTIIDLAITRGWSASNIILQTGFYQNGWTNPWGGVTVTPANDTRWQAFITATKEVAATNGLTCVDQSGVYGASDTAADGVHPLASGYAKIATYFGSIVS